MKGRMDKAMNGDIPNEKEKIHQEEIDRETRCGFGFCPESVQWCANLPCFTFSYSMCAFLTQSLTVYISSQITSIEKQFGFSGKQTGFLISCNEIGFILSALIISHFLGQRHIPKYLGLVTIVFGISGITCALPHLIFGVNSDWIVSSSDEDDGELCRRGDNTTNVLLENCSGAGVSITNAAIGIIATGMIIQGVAKGPRTALVATYVDNNVNDRAKTGIYIGLLTAVSVLGPAAAVGLGGVFSGLHVTLEDVEMKPTDPKWVGAWWLGFIIFGALAIMVGIPVCLFPRRMPIKPVKLETNEDDRPTLYELEIDSNIEQKHYDKKTKENSLKQYFVDFLRVHKRLVQNGAFVFIVLSSGIKMLSFSGLVYYTPKYVEKEFIETAWKANFIVGGLSMIDVFGGTVFGGFLTSRLKLTRMGNMKLILGASVISCISIGLTMLVGCDQPVIDDFNRIRNPRSMLEQAGSISNMCSTGCSCNSTDFYPVCGINGTNFYSACHAGCNNRTAEEFTGCFCGRTEGTATAGFCDQGCSDLIFFCILLTAMALSMTIQVVPTYMIVIRSVTEEEKAAAVGINAVCNTLLGWLPGSLLFGLIFDESCLIWNEICNRTGSCALYDLKHLRISFFSLTLGTNLLSFIFLIAAFMKIRTTDCKSMDLTGRKPRTIELHAQ